MYQRIFFSALLSLVWFLHLFGKIITGEIFMKQIDIDKKKYENFVSEESEKYVYELKKTLQIPDEYIKKTIISKMGSFDDIINSFYYFSRSISTKQLAEIIAYEFYSQNKDIRIEEDNAFDFVEKRITNLPSLTSEIQKEFQIISRDPIDKSLAYNDLSIFNEYLTWHTLDTGLTFYCALTDTEVPVLFMIYWNGHKLKAYLPFPNMINYKEKTLFGLDKEKDLEYITSKLGNNITKENMYELFANKCINFKLIKENMEKEVPFMHLNGTYPSKCWDDIPQYSRLKS